MSWLLLILFPTATFAIQVATATECAELGRTNLAAAKAFSQATPKIVCAKTYAI